MAGGRLQTDPLFQGLTRPAMLFGVSLSYFIINFTIIMALFINTKNMLVIFVLAPAIHGLGYLICLKEPRAIELSAIKLAKTLKCKPKNRIFHGSTNSYDIY